MLKKIIAMATLLLISACDWNKQEDVDISNLENKARSAPLRERYDLYRKVYSLELPPNTQLADEVVAYGNGAMSIALSDAKGGNVEDISAAIEIISLFNRTYKRSCNESDIRDIAKNISEKFSKKETAEVVIKRVGIACRPPSLKS